LLLQSIPAKDNASVNSAGTTGGAFEKISQSVWARAAVLVLLTLAAYLPAMRGGFLWDDDVYLTNNVLLTAPDGLRRIWFSLDAPSQYFPLVYTSFRLESMLWDFDPLGYHLVNLILHIANALLVWSVLARLKVPGAWLAAGIFALHPVHVESVAWITERKNVMMCFFFLLALLAWITFIDEQTKHRHRFYVMALVFYTLALFSKSLACTLPVALVLVLWLQKRPIDLRRVIQIAPFVLLGLLMGLVAIWWEHYHQRARGALFTFSLLERFLIASRAVWFYAGKLIWPAKLTFIYPRWQTNVADPRAYVWLIAIAAVGALIYRLRWRLERGVLVGIAFFVLTLAPVLGLVIFYLFRYTFVADHYQYIASIGLIALFAAALSTLARNWRIGGQMEVACSAVLFLGLGGLTWRQAHIYRDLETLWRDTLRKNPACWMAHDNLGVILDSQHKFEEAKAHFEMARALNPTDAESQNNVGAALLDQGDIGEAEAHLLAAVRLDPSLPGPHTNLGILLVAQGRLDEAIEHYRRSLQLDPGQAEAHNNLGIVLARQGKLDESIASFRSALRCNANFVQAYSNLGNVLALQGDFEGAIYSYEQALRLNPDFAQAHFNAGHLLAKIGRRQEAVAHLTEALRIKPDYVEAKQQLRALGVEPGP
jgi:tetratricopeptide (TPR) repeat protein